MVSGTGGTSRTGGQEGSVIVAAAAFVVVLGLVVATATARSVGMSAAALGAHERAAARAHAEHGLMLAIGELGSASARGDIVGRRAVAGTTLLRDASILSAPGAPLSVGASMLGDGSDLIELTVEATVGRATASARASVRPRLTTDLALITEHRALDPALHGIPRVGCTHPPGTPGRDTRCLEPALSVGAVDGPVHTNEAPPPGLVVVASVHTTSALGSTDAAHRTEIGLPRSVTDVLGDAPVTCRFRGPTLLRFDGATVRVRSPRSAPRAGEMLESAARIGCMGVDRSELVDVVAITLPDRAIIEVVRDDDASCLVHPLGVAHGEDGLTDWLCDGGDAFVWGRYRGARTVLAEDAVQIVWDLEPGDATMPAPHSDGDVLGLVAGDSIVLRRLVGPESWTAFYGTNVASVGPWMPPFGAFPLDAPTSGPSRWDSPRVVAALAALRGTVTIQNVFRGEVHSGELTIVGSVASRFTPSLAWEHRSTSGALLGATGYRAELRYDPRLDRTPPPAMPMIDGGRVRILELDVG